MSPTVKIIAIFGYFWRIFKSNFNSYVTLSLTFSQSFFEQKCLRTAKIIAIFSDFCYFEIKPEMRDVQEKMRELSQNVGFPARLRDGWHLCIFITRNKCQLPQLSKVECSKCYSQAYLIDLSANSGGLLNCLRLDSENQPLEVTNATIRSNVQLTSRPPLEDCSLVIIYSHLAPVCPE